MPKNVNHKHESIYPRSERKINGRRCVGQHVNSKPVRECVHLMGRQNEAADGGVDWRIHQYLRASTDVFHDINYNPALIGIGV
jgi:hypothetical protein